MKTLNENEIKRLYFFTLESKFDLLRSDPKCVELGKFLSSDRVFINQKYESLFCLYASLFSEIFQRHNAWEMTMQGYTKKEMNLHILGYTMMRWIYLPMFLIEVKPHYQELNIVWDDFERKVISFWLELPKVMQEFVSLWGLKESQLPILEKAYHSFFKGIKLKEVSNNKKFIKDHVLKNVEFKNLLLFWASAQDNLKDLTEEVILNHVFELLFTDLTSITLNYMAGYVFLTFDDYHNARLIKAEYVYPRVQTALLGSYNQ